jgi:hypothetical protein
VKQSLLRWFGACGAWSAHAMFTGRVSPDEAAAAGQINGILLQTS